MRAGNDIQKPLGPFASFGSELPQKVTAAAPVDPGLAIINDQAAGFFVIDADLQEYPNKVPSTSDVMTRGSTTGVDTGDPSIYGGYSVPVLTFPGDADNYVQEDTGRTYTVTSSIAVVFDFGPDGVQPIPAGSFRCPGGVGGTNVANRFYMNAAAGTTNYQAVYVDSVSGDSVVLSATTVTVGIRFVRMLAEVGVGLQLQESSDGASWTTLVTGGTISTTTTLTWKISAGRLPYTSGHPYSGVLAGVSVELDGAEVERVHAADNSTESQASWVSSYGETCTVYRSVTGLKTVWVGAGQWLSQSDGAGDRFEFGTDMTADFTATTGGYTMLLLGRVFGNSGWNARRLFNGESSAGNGLSFLGETGGKVELVVYGDAGNSTVSQSGTATDGDWIVWGFRQDDGSAQAYDDVAGLSASQSTTAVGTITHETPKLYTRAYSSIIGTNNDLKAIVIFKEALTESEMNDVATYMRGLL